MGLLQVLENVEELGNGMVVDEHDFLERGYNTASTRNSNLDRRGRTCGNAKNVR